MRGRLGRFAIYFTPSLTTWQSGLGLPSPITQAHYVSGKATNLTFAVCYQLFALNLHTNTTEVLRPEPQKRRYVDFTEVSYKGPI